MRVSVRFFSNLSKLIGSQQVELELPEAARIADLSRQLKEMYPEHSALLGGLVFLIDGRSTTPNTELADGAQVLALMVLSGGANQF